MISDLQVSHQTILDCIDQGVYVCDRQRRILYWNKTAEAITGWRSEDVLGRSCRDGILSHIDKNGRRLCGDEYCPLHRAMVTGSSTSMPVIVYAMGKNGQRIPMQVSAAPIVDAEGNVVGGVESFRDISPIMPDLRRAQHLQKRLLGTSLPEDPRLVFSKLYVPRDIVGGDYYAVKAIDRDYYAFILADMEGHGVAAALYTMHLSILWEKHAALLSSPQRFAAEVNHDLVQILGPDNSFATAVCGVLDARSGKVAFATAGGPPPMVVHADASISVKNGQGVPLGVVEDYPYQEQSFRLEPGDAVLLCSDGAFEIHNAQDEPLNQEGFIRIVEKQIQADDGLHWERLEDALLKYSNVIRLQDDLTVLLISYNGNVDG